MDTVRIANLKSIRDSGIIELKPITALVGKNSSGKSSFLRFFSLLRQSNEVRTRSPFLWYGQYVDYGSFKEALRYNADPQEIVLEFSFGLTSDLLEDVSPSHWYFRHIKKRLASLSDITASVELTLVCPQDTARFSSIVLTVGDDKINLSFDDGDKVNAFLVNDLDIISLTQEYVTLAMGKTIPVITTKKLPEFVDKRRDYYSYVYGGVDIATQAALVKATSSLFHGNTAPSKRNNIVNRITIEPLPQFYQSLLSIPAGSVFQSNVQALAGNIFMTKIRNLAIASIVPGILLIADEELSRVAHNVRSIAPIRATAERYYRKQDLGIDEVDYKGQNLAMYLGGLSAGEMNSFQEWTIENLKFRVSVKDSEGHLAVFLQEQEGSNKYNLADSGFGFSQILPIVAQLWSILNPRILSRRKVSAANIFTIEQPELHLHPSLQAKVADLLIAAIKQAKEKKIQLKLIVETHSEAIINRLGNQIARGNLSCQDVNIVLFEKRGPNDSTEVSLASYSKDGYLQNWPFGFFEAEEE